MTDKELLQECLDAFRAIPVDAAARKTLKRIGHDPKWGVGNASQALAKHYVEEIERHLAANAK